MCLSIPPPEPVFWAQELKKKARGSFSDVRAQARHFRGPLPQLRMWFPVNGGVKQALCRSLPSQTRPPLPPERGSLASRTEGAAVQGSPPSRLGTSPHVLTASGPGISFLLAQTVFHRLDSDMSGLRRYPKPWQDLKEE